MGIRFGYAAAATVSCCHAADVARAPVCRGVTTAANDATIPDMTNIPTELLRTLVAVVDHKSFTKAAMSLGVTQPAVSAQIKRLHGLLGFDLFDKNAPGISLTAAGDSVITYARRLLAINDQILQVAEPLPPATRTLRLGLTGDYISPFLPRALANFRRQWPYRKFHAITGSNERLLHDLRIGELDLVVLLTSEKAELDARHYWTEDMIWGRGATIELDPDLPVPLVTRGPHWMNHRLGVAALERAGRAYDVVFTGPTILSLMSAVRAGLGIMPFARRRILNTDLVICDELQLPPLPSFVCSIYISEVGDTVAMQHLADAVATAIRPPASVSVRTEGEPYEELRVPLSDLLDETL